MSIGLTLLWVGLVIASLVTPVVCLVVLFKKVRRVFLALSSGAEQLGQVPSRVQPNQCAPLRPSGILSQPEVLAQAHQMRAEVRLLRQLRRADRLEKAQSRWARLGLVK